jgi:plasmid stabilization system protein ParE
MKAVRIAAVAIDELREAESWYEERALGLGKRLVQAVDRALADVAENPSRFRVLHRDIRRALARPFPYGIFFRDMGEFVRVIAIVHLHRHPGIWRRRS